MNSFCPFEFYDLYDGKVRNPCTLLSCQSENAQNNEVCVESVRIYCERSELEKGYVEIGCFGISKKNQHVTTMAPKPSTTTSTPVDSFCPFEFYDLYDGKVRNPCTLLSCQSENAQNNEVCVESVRIYCERSELEKGYVEVGCFGIGKNEQITTSPSPWTCPYKYNDLANGESM